jgi:predicted dehydrogenase
LNQKTRIGVIGLGIMDAEYVRVYQSHPLAEVTAIAFRTPDKAAGVAAHYRVPHICADWRESVSRADVDAVCVATPDNLHYEPVRAAMEVGKHVLIESP